MVHGLAHRCAGVNPHPGDGNHWDATPSAVCETIYQAESVKAMGDHSAAFEVMCDLPQVRAARKRAGNLCWADRPENQPKAGEPTDPYVRKRMGLPPL